MQKFGWFWGLGVTQGYQQNREHTTSYSTLIETICIYLVLFLSYSAFSIKSGQF